MTDPTFRLPPPTTEGPLHRPDGPPLHVRTWRPAGAPLAHVVLVHGFGDHAGLYPTVAAALPAAGFQLWAPDLRGHGRSPGRRGHVDRWSDFRADLDAVVAQATAAAGGAPPFVLGSSLGGVVALEHALTHPGRVRGVAAAGPPLGAVGLSPTRLALARFLSRLWPTFTLASDLDLSNLARDPAVPAAVLADPHFHRLGSARLATEYFAAVARVHAGAAAFPVPALLQHGTADVIAHPDGSRRFAAAARGRPVTLLEYAGGYHGLYVDLDRERTLGDLVDWLRTVAGAGA